MSYMEMEIPIEDDGTMIDMCVFVSNCWKEKR
jgi:hypothetical protein